MFGPIDPRDVFYVLTGACFIGLTFLPMMCGVRLISVPTLYVALGAVVTLSPFALPVLDPMRGDLSLAVVEHATELIVIVALAGAGLAVDRRATLKAWQHTWLLLAIAMPLTIAAIAWLGWQFGGLTLAGTALLAAALSPTDPVLARSVQVEGPNQGEEDDVRVALTTEAGLNDGLAFPFVHLALALALFQAGKAEADWISSWLTFDLAYRVIAACIIGWLGGTLFSRFVYSRYGDAQDDGANAGLVMMSSTFMIYGAAELIDAYGFLAVFIGARTGRAYGRREGGDDYVEHPHQFSDQVEKILLALLLLWVGSVAVSGMLSEWQWTEIAIAFVIVFAVRPAAGMLALWPTRGDIKEKVAMAFFGVRGMGTFFYIAYAQSHGTFGDIETVWRIALITVLLSILVHGVLAPFAMQRLSSVKVRSARLEENTA